MEDAIAFGNDLHTGYNEYLTCFHGVCESGFTEVVKIFMENADTFGLELNAEDRYGLTPFHNACIEGHSDVVKIFMENAAKLNSIQKRRLDSFP